MSKQALTTESDLNSITSRQEENNPPPTPSRELVEKSEDVAPAGLPQWWTQYPSHRRCSKQRAVELWNAATTKLDPTAMILRLTDQCASHDWVKDQGRYVPSMEKYLQTEGWLSPILAAPLERPKTWADWQAGGTGKAVL